MKEKTNNDNKTIKEEHNSEEENNFKDRKTIFGFHSRNPLKIIIAIFYYFVLLLLVYATLSVWKTDLSLRDMLVDKVSDLLFLLLYISPFILLSDFSKKLRSKIPLLKNNNPGMTVLFFFILFFLITTTGIAIESLYSKEYKEKVRIEEEQRVNARQEEMKKEKEKKAQEKQKKEKEQKEAMEKKAQEEQKRLEEEQKAKAEAKINEEKNFKESCNIYTYKEIARNPNKYKGENVKFTGKVMQVTEDFINSNFITILLQVTKNEYDLYDDTIYCNYTYESGEDKILNDDIITIYGICEGDTSYISVLGSSITVPKINIKYYTLE